MQEKKSIGRPTSYKPEYCQSIREFFNVELTRQRIEECNGKDGAYTIIKTIGNLLPTFAKYASTIGVHRETLLNWCNDFPAFFDAYKDAKQLQENFLVQNALSGDYKASAAIFCMKNMLGWRDKSETNVVAEGGLTLAYALKSETTNRDQ